MKKLTFICLAMLALTSAQAAGHLPEKAASAPSSPETLLMSGPDTIYSTSTLNRIIEIENTEHNDNDIEERQQRIWKRNTYLNISYNKTKLSSDEFPATAGVFSNEYDNDFGVGIQWGHTFNFHKKPLGDVLFFGLDFTWLDLNYNGYKLAAIPAGYTDEGLVKNMPWHNKKETVDFGLSLGPSLTLYPFTSTRNAGTDNFRLQGWFHVGYSAHLARVKEVNSSTGNSTEDIFGHGLFTAFGASLSWNFIGVGIELRNNSGIRFKPVNKEFDTGKMKADQKTTRFFLQFRF